MYNKKRLLFTLFTSLLILSTTLSLIGAEEDFDYDINYIISDDAIEAGKEVNVTITLTGRYIAEEPYVLNKQVEAKMELFLDGEKISEATVPAGPMELVPYQDLTISETVPGLIPSTTLPGTHELVLRSSFEALGYDFSEEKAFPIEVLSPQSSPVSKPPSLYFSLSPLQMYKGSTSTLTVRIFNPNEAAMDLAISLYTETNGFENLLDTYILMLEGGCSEEIRRTFKLLDGDLCNLCFLAKLEWYELNGERYENVFEMGQCANLLKRPSLRAIVFNDNYVDLNDGTFQSDLHVVFINETGWRNSLIVDNMVYSIILPNEIEMMDGPRYELWNVRKDTEAILKIRGPLDTYLDQSGRVEGTYLFGDPKETVEFVSPFLMPSTDEVRIMFGYGPLSGERQDDEGSKLGITAFLISHKGYTDKRDDINEIFSYLDMIFQ